MENDRVRKKSILVGMAVLFIVILATCLIYLLFTNHTGAVNRNADSYLEKMVNYVEERYGKMDNYHVIGGRIYIFSNTEKMQTVKVSNTLMISDSITGISYKVVGDENGEFTVEEISEVKFPLTDWDWSTFRKQVIAIDYAAYLSDYEFGVLELFDETDSSIIRTDTELPIESFLWKKNDFVAAKNITGQYKGITFVPSNLYEDTLTDSSGIMLDGQGYVFFSK